MGHKVLYLILPPIHIDHDLEVEKQVIDDFKEFGIYTKLSEEDIGLYGFKEGFVKERGNVEYIYSYLSFMNEGRVLGGKIMKRWRRALNVFRKMEGEGIVSVEYINYVNKDLSDFESIECFAKSWTSTHKKYSKEPKHLAHLKNLFGCGGFMLLVLKNILNKPVKVIGYSLTEVVGRGKVVITNRIRDYDDYLLYDHTSLMHLLELRYYTWIFDDCLFNFGSAVNMKGLGFSKDKLMPVKKLQIYDYGKSKVTDEVFKLFEPKKEEEE